MLPEYMMEPVADVFSDPLNYLLACEGEEVFDNHLGIREQYELLEELSCDYEHEEQVSEAHVHELLNRAVKRVVHKVKDMPFEVALAALMKLGLSEEEAIDELVS